MSNWSKWLLVAVPVCLIPTLVLWYWPRPRNVMYSLYRERGKTLTLAGLEGYARRQSDHFEIWYTKNDAENVDMILRTAESVYEPVADAVGYRVDKVPLIVYPSRSVLRQAFGWGTGESAMGVYWEGTIRLLSPNVWIGEESMRLRQQVFRKLNPIAHELTHYLLDYKTGGNYPRWFTEGLAQRIEYKVTGYLWVEEKSTLRQQLYALDDLVKRFDQLPNQPLAYRQSFLLVDYMAHTYGEERLTALIEQLSRGTSFNDSVKTTLGEPIATIFESWLDFVAEHLDELDAAS